MIGNVPGKDKPANTNLHCHGWAGFPFLQPDASEQDPMRRLLTACIASLTEPLASAT
jgi:hypothetical protein